MSEFENVIRVYGDGSHEAHREPQPITLPEKPTSQEIRKARKHGNMTKEEAAEICSVSICTWRRWEREGGIRLSVWAWFRVVVYGGFVAGGKEWEGWKLYEGRLHSPEGWGAFTSSELRAWPYMHAQIRELKLVNRKLEEENAALKTSTEHEQRDNARGQVSTLQSVIGVLINQYEDHEDPLLDQLSKSLHDLLMKACEVNTPLLEDRL